MIDHRVDVVPVRGDGRQLPGIRRLGTAPGSAPARTAPAARATGCTGRSSPPAAPTGRSRWCPSRTRRSRRWRDRPSSCSRCAARRTPPRPACRRRARTARRGRRRSASPPRRRGRAPARRCPPIWPAIAGTVEVTRTLCSTVSSFGDCADGIAATTTSATAKATSVFIGVPLGGDSCTDRGACGYWRRNASQSASMASSDAPNDSSIRLRIVLNDSSRVPLRKYCNTAGRP